MENQNHVHSAATFSSKQCGIFAYLSQNAYFGGFYVLEKPPALAWYYARAVASSLFSRYRHVSQYTWVDYSAADGRTVVSQKVQT